MYQLNTLMSMCLTLMSMFMERFCDLKPNLWLIDEYIDTLGKIHIKIWGMFNVHGRKH